MIVRERARGRHDRRALFRASCILGSYAGICRAKTEVLRTVLICLLTRGERCRSQTP